MGDHVSTLGKAGDTGNTIANTAKVLFQTLEWWVRNIAGDIYDLEKSPKAKESFLEE